MGLNNLSVFVVDDDVSFNKMITKILKKMGIKKINSFYNGEDCIANLEIEPNIVVLDYNLENSKGRLRTGLQIAEIIKKESPLTYIIMLSGEMQNDLNRFTDPRFIDNIDRYLVKDMDHISNLHETINEFSF